MDLPVRHAYWLKSKVNGRLVIWKKPDGTTITATGVVDAEHLVPANAVYLGAVTEYVKTVVDQRRGSKELVILSK
jgi:hypothetical protein